MVILFIDWLDAYSDFHFEVIGKIYNRQGITRGEIWRGLGKPPVAENSAEADLYKMLIRDLSMGGVVRQHRETDWSGAFVRKQAPKTPKGQGSRVMVSAFDDSERYELTELGRQFVHYAMNELAPRLAFDEGAEAPAGV